MLTSGAVKNAFQVLAGDAEVQVVPSTSIFTVTIQSPEQNPIRFVVDKNSGEIAIK